MATVASAANTGLPLATWFGAVAGMVTADSLGIIVGQLLHRIPAWIIKGVSSAVFFIFGWTTLNETWAIGIWWNYLGLVPLIIGVWLIWRQRTQVALKTRQS